jgi:hypothetical protein
VSAKVKPADQVLMIYSLHHHLEEDLDLAVEDLVVGLAPILLVDGLHIPQDRGSDQEMQMVFMMMGHQWMI